MSGRMMIVVDGTVKAIFVAGDMVGGVQIRSNGDQPGVSPERVSQDFFSTLRQVPASAPDYQRVASEAAIVGRERGLFDFHGEIRDPAKMDAIIAEVMGVAEPEPGPAEVAIPDNRPPQPERPVIRPSEDEPANGQHASDPSSDTVLGPSPIVAETPEPAAPVEPLPEATPAA